MGSEPCYDGAFRAPYVPSPTTPQAPGPIGEWVDDLLGPGFERRTMRVPVGSGVSTLVRYRADLDPHAIPGSPARVRFLVLYVHGWNDYFFQREMARHFARAGAAFYAVDLHHYGRSLRKGDVPGWCTSLGQFAPDLRASMSVMRAEHPGLPVILAGHSTGGLLAVLWAQRHEDELAGLWLTSPWLELQVGPSKRRAYNRVLGALSRVRGSQRLPIGPDESYAVSLRGWNNEAAPLPPDLAEFADDPSVSGFDLVDEWKRAAGNPILAGWLHAITQGHTELATARLMDVPVLLHASTATYQRTGPDWDERALSADAVLHANYLVAAGANVSTRVDIRRHPSKHDPILSFPRVRQAVWGDVHEWLDRVLATEPMGPDARYAICP